MKITTIILSHYYERKDNLVKIINDLESGTVVPDEIVVFIDNPDIEFDYSLGREKIMVIKSNKILLPKIRFSLASYFDSDYFFFIDDDLSVKKKTLENLNKYANIYTDTILGFEGSILGHTTSPYANDTSIKRGNKLVDVDIIIRTYFVPRECLLGGLALYMENPTLPRKFLDDVYLCLGNKYIGEKNNKVIPVDGESDLSEIGECGVGQSKSGEHYQVRNEVCYALMQKYG